MTSLADFTGTVLVTGAGGHVGRHLCRTLKDGGASVLGMHGLAERIAALTTR